MSAPTDIADDVLTILATVLDVIHGVLRRHDLTEPRLLQIRERVAALQDCIHDRWADLAFGELEDERQLRLADLEVDDLSAHVF